MNEIKQLLELKDNQSVLFQLQSILADILKAEFDKEVDVYSIDINPAQDEKFGDYTTNIGLKLSKELGKSPREIAETISANLKASFIEKTEVAGPGFVNITLGLNYYIEMLNRILAFGDAYGKWEVSNEQVIIEYGHPNTHKAIQVSHLKSLATGLGILRLVENLGYEVIQANFFSDIGMHVAKCVWAYLRKMQDVDEKEKFDAITDPHERMKYLNDCYAYGSAQFKDDPAAKEEIVSINNKIYTKSDEKIYKVYLQTREWTIEHQAVVFKKFGVMYHRQYPESEVIEEGIRIVKENIGKVFTEDQGAVIFKGDEYSLQTFVFISKDGHPTYPGKDIGLANIKFKEFPDLQFGIIPIAVEQDAHFKTVIKALELVDARFKDRYYHLPFGHLLRDNKKTSSRQGGTAKAMDLLNESLEYSLKKITEHKEYSEYQAKEIAEKVSIAGIKFLILSHELHKDINYNPEQFLNPEGFSGPYVLYGYVRAKSILRQGAGSGKHEDVTAQIVSSSLTPPASSYNLNSSELRLLKLLSQYPLIAFDAGRTLAPHKICYYLFELTQTFNQFYKENKVLVEEEEVKNFRLGLTQGVATVLKNGLGLLGIETIEQM